MGELWAAPGNSQDIWGGANPHGDLQEGVKNQESAIIQGGKLPGSQGKADCGTFKSRA